MVRSCSLIIIYGMLLDLDAEHMMKTDLLLFLRPVRLVVLCIFVIY